MMKWESPNDVLKQLPPVRLGCRENEGFCPHYSRQPLPRPWSKQVMFRQLESTPFFPLGILKFKLRFQANQHVRFSQSMRCGWCLGSVPLGLQTPFTPGQAPTRLVSTGIPRSSPNGLNPGLWWPTGSGEALQPVLPRAIFLQFHSFWLTLHQRVGSWSWNYRSCHSPNSDCRLARCQSSDPVWPHWELNPGPHRWKVSTLPLGHPDNLFSWVFQVFYILKVVSIVGLCTIQAMSDGI